VAISANATAAEIEAAALAAGMRPMLASGTAKVLDGQVSAAELDRVLKFST
jgi:type II secretory ATPase GspE/PulE/Tfp pilus assembly ATPase PilB-like protein